ncbi:MAG: hypothetical protein K0R39_4187 [Symbiobacteriaceae bacterium]|jgi:hypothetical protein|nr:hypothetical protein [Symbiobacteriaceae bacterium]
MIYLAGSAAANAIEGFSTVEVIPFGLLSRMDFQIRLNWVLGFALLAWVVWGVKFVDEGAPSTPPADADQHTASPPGA